MNTDPDVPNFTTAIDLEFSKFHYCKFGDWVQ